MPNKSPNKVYEYLVIMAWALVEDEAATVEYVAFVVFCGFNDNAYDLWIASFVWYCTWQSVDLKAAPFQEIFNV